MNEKKRVGVKSFDHELKSESFDYFTPKEKKKLKKEFLLKILTKYSLYSWLLFLGIMAITALIIAVLLLVNSPWKYLVFIAAGGYIPLLIFLVNILQTTKNKYRYFLFVNHKLKEEGFNDFYFRSYMITLCYRLIIKDLLKKYGFIDRYQYLYDNFSTKEKVNAFITHEAISDIIGDDVANIEIEELQIDK